MSAIIPSRDIGGVIVKQLGLENMHVRRIIIFLATRQDESPWDYIQYDEEAIVIRVWDTDDQIAILKAFCLTPKYWRVAIFDLEWNSITTVILRGIAQVDIENGALDTIRGIAGSPLTSTHLPAGPLSAHGVRVPGYVVEGNRDIMAGAQGGRRPYKDLDEPMIQDKLDRLP